ncbi:cytochrome c3 family protein [Desulfohalovibrio reitneri]|uniref:cytochrome c3 family protein n=1 Tax=Desulfohalovibrio reitneri TaxID=1307759 RepID=UPI0004A6C357|nr:NapC/NirT family cytochrome c [Desulfohalovibrio reitneri]
MQKRSTFRTIGLVVLGLVLGAPIFHFTIVAMAETSTPEFCGTCHEIQPAVENWSTSTHANNERGVVADCMDCHIPPPENVAQFVYLKSKHGLRDITSHLINGPEGYDREEAREGAWGEIENEWCMRCHDRLLDMPNKRGAMLAHRSVLYARPGNEKKCTDCHYNLVHVDRGFHEYANLREVPYRSPGLRQVGNN